MTKFEVGKTYATCSICDSDCWFEYTVIKRTKCTVTLRDKFGNERRRKIQFSRYDDAEIVYPQGSYSMCPILDAGRDEVIEEQELPENVISIDAWKSRKAI